LAGASSAVSTPVLRDFKQKYTIPVDRWFSNFQKPLFRYPFLMVVGPSKTGKSQFAVGMMKRHGIRSPYVVCGGFDLKGFDRTKNGGIVLNDVCGIASYII
jgi:hypothetical protein